MFFQNFQNFLKISQQFAFFVQTREKINAWFVNFLEKYAKIMHFRNFLKNFFKIFENFLKISKILCFCPNSQKINAWFVKFFEKYAKIMRFRNFLKKVFENFRKLFPRKNPGYAHAYRFLQYYYDIQFCA